jgi:hypothetical protein
MLAGKWVLMAARSMNPFAKMRSMCDGQEEDHLTEFIAGALGVSEEFRPAYRKRFLASCKRLSRFRWKAILVEATLEDIRGGLEPFDIPSEVHPNAVCGTLDAIEAKFGIPIIYSSSIRDLATERAASWLSKHFTHWWLEKQGLGRVLIDSDGL